MPTIDGESNLVAPLWHTGLVLLIFLITFGAGSLVPHGTGPPRTFSLTEYRELIYIAGLLLQWGLFALVYMGLFASKTLSTLLGKTWNDSWDITRDVGLGIGAIVLVFGLSGAFFSLFGPVDRDNIDVYPKTAVQFYFFFLLSVSAGFAEEVIFRGYFLKQLAYLFKCETGAILLQALLFSLAHVGERLPWIFEKFLIGLLFGYIASRRKSLMPTIVAHCGINAIGAIFSVVH